MTKGRFISFEGVDGTGKSTQVFLLAKKLKEEGYDIVLTKEPGSEAEPTGLGKEIRKILFHTITTNNMARGVADCLFLADHIQHVEKLIKPALEAGQLVISDRYSDSEFAYAASKQPQAGILQAYRECYGPIPNLTILFVAGDIQSCLERARARRGETQQAGKAWNDVHEQMLIQSAYLSELVGRSGTVVINVNNMDTPDQIFNTSVWPAVKFYLDTPITEQDMTSSNVGV